MNPRAIPAALVFALLGVIIVAPLAGLVNLSAMPGYETGDLQFWQSAYIRRVLSFSLWQALLSTFCSVLPAILVARAFALQPSFPLRVNSGRMSGALSGRVGNLWWGEGGLLRSVKL